jgi:hypothetical protein
MRFPRHRCRSAWRLTGAQSDDFDRPHPVTANVVSVISQAAVATAMIAAHLCGARKPGLIYQLSRYFQIAGDAGHPPSLYGYKGWLPCKVVLALFISWKFE